MLFRLRKRLHHRFERRGEEEGVGNALGLQQLKRRFGAEPAVEGDDFAAEIQRWQERVHQPARPRPIGGAPEDGP